ncbi:hypothetical protein H920_17911 [Fukomys damarensis]|uniref:Uncharacterized protein n=1 Tax=Fukomys damarensis TaxID=885580 RepID=A0A091CT93_FUKDA|nr:hypothetical protein H920_17911 [Fukomys damarensis]
MVWVDDDDDDDDGLDIGHVGQSSCGNEMAQESTDTDTRNADLLPSNDKGNNTVRHEPEENCISVSLCQKKPSENYGEQITSVEDFWALK